jgi:hypothetical protein
MAQRTKAIASIAIAFAGVSALVACSSDDAPAPTDAGGQDAKSDVTVASDAGSDTGVTDSGTDSTIPDGAIQDGSIVLDGHTKPDTGHTGALGETCTTPGNTCDTGLFCNEAKRCQTDLCSGKPLKALPYPIKNDFATVYTIGPEKGNFAILPASPDCDSTTFPAIPDTGLGDSGTDAALPTLLDGGVQTVTYASTPACYEILYDPSCINGSQGVCWAGAIFTNSEATAAAAANGNTSAAAVGVCLASGANQITFWARSSNPAAVVKFGSSRPGACTVNPITDGDGGPPNRATEQSSCPRATEFFLHLSSEWRQYTVSMADDEPYNNEPAAGGGVWNSFSIVVEPAPFAGGGYILVKDVVWGNSNGIPDAGTDAAVAPDAAVAADATPE